MSILEEFKLLKGNSELLTVETIVDWARDNPNSDFHKRLIWDDTRAGHLYRCWQVRTILAIHIRDDVKAREIISLTIDRVNRGGGGYRLTSEVLERPDLVTVMLSDALNELERVKAKYANLLELHNVWQEVEAANERAAKRGKGKKTPVKTRRPSRGGRASAN